MNKFKGEIKKNKEKYFSNKPFASFLQVFDLGSFWMLRGTSSIFADETNEEQARRIKGRGAWSQEKVEKKKGEWGMVLSTL